MQNSSRMIMLVAVVLVIITIASEIASIAAFYGVGADAWPVCGSACEIWPGIPTGEVCILICVARNGAYVPLFYAGLVTGCCACGAVIFGLIKKRRVPGNN